jgi:hypothetical protein
MKSAEIGSRSAPGISPLGRNSAPHLRGTIDTFVVSPPWRGQSTARLPLFVRRPSALRSRFVTRRESSTQHGKSIFIGRRTAAAREITSRSSIVSQWNSAPMRNHRGNNSRQSRRQFESLEIRACLSAVGGLADADFSPPDRHAIDAGAAAQPDDVIDPADGRDAADLRCKLAAGVLSGSSASRDFGHAVLAMAPAAAAIERAAPLADDGDVPAAIDDCFASGVWCHDPAASSAGDLLPPAPVAGGATAIERSLAAAMALAGAFHLAHKPDERDEASRGKRLA